MLRARSCGHSPLISSPAPVVPSVSSASASLVLRPAAAPDLVEIRALLVETWHDTYDPLFGYEEVASFTDRLHAVEKLAGELGRASHVFLVAEREDGLAGTVSATLGDDRVLTIGRLYVRPAQQRAGIGRALLEAALAAFPTAQVARLEVEGGNAKGRAFYERNGFTWTAKIGHAEAGEALVYERPLPGALPRLARDDDAQDLFGLLALCFAEYPGCYVDPHEDLTDLRHPSRSFGQRGGAFWVAEDARGRVCACIAIDYPAEREGELHRLYVRPDLRRRGLGERLIRLAEDHARERGARNMFFWSDTRFTNAHRLYTRLGYARAEATRALGDVSRSVEYRFEKAL